jgi:hypothetical protein
MKNQEKYEKWRQVAQAMLKDQAIIFEVGVERAEKEYGVKFKKSKTSQLRESI